MKTQINTYTIFVNGQEYPQKFQSLNEVFDLIRTFFNAGVGENIIIVRTSEKML